MEIGLITPEFLHSITFLLCAFGVCAFIGIWLRISCESKKIQNNLDAAEAILRCFDKNTQNEILDTMLKEDEQKQTKIFKHVEPEEFGVLPRLITLCGVVAFLIWML